MGRNQVYFLAVNGQPSFLFVGDDVTGLQAGFGQSFNQSPDFAVAGLVVIKGIGSLNQAGYPAFAGAGEINFEIIGRLVVKEFFAAPFQFEKDLVFEQAAPVFAEAVA